MSDLKNMKKSQFYVNYYGWKECRGVAGREFTDPIVQEMVYRRRQEQLPKLTVEVCVNEYTVACRGKWVHGQGVPGAGFIVF
jgi:hypothetical protein